jgi:hypothetical protein
MCNCKGHLTRSMTVSGKPPLPANGESESPVSARLLPLQPALTAASQVQQLQGGQISISTGTVHFSISKYKLPTKLTNKSVDLVDDEIILVSIDAYF